jgi:hypothetical protein
MALLQEGIVSDLCFINNFGFFLQLNIDSQDLALLVLAIGSE